MFKILRLLFCLWILVMSIAQAEARPYTLTATSEVQLKANQTLDDARMLAVLGALKQIYQQLESFVATYEPLKSTIKPEYRLPFALRTFSLERLSDRPQAGARSVEVKFKAWADSDLFPENPAEFAKKEMYVFESMRQHTQYVLELEEHVRQYLEQLAQLRDPTEVYQLRQSQGAPLSAQFKALGKAIQGYDSFERERWDEAIRYFGEAIQQDPSYANAYFGRGIAYFQKRQYDSALADLNKALERDSKLSVLYFIRGAVYLTQGVLMDKVIEDMNTMLQAYPEHADAYYLRGIAYREKKSCTQANRDFEKACSLGQQEACSKQCSQVPSHLPKPNHH